MTGRQNIGWAERGACVDHPDIDLAWSTSTRHQRRFAQQVCAGCPVREPCADHAIRHCETEGVWGGLTEEQLRAAVRLRRKVPA